MHVGKLYPYAPRWFQPFPDGVRRLPSRRMAVENNGTGGAVGAMWNSVEMLSDPVVEDQTPNLFWLVPNTSYPDTEVHLRIDYAVTPPSTGFVGPLCWKLFLEVWYLGSKLTWSEGYRQVSNAWNSTGEIFRAPMSGTSIWNGSPSPSLWTGGFFTLRVGTWEESPEYHPYRH